MILKEDIQAIITEIIKNNLSGKDIFIVEIKVSGNNEISVFIDSLKSVNIDDCVIISKAVEEKIDREQYDFSLTVSSAGLESTFKVPLQYEKNIGKKIEILTFDGIKIRAKLVSVSKTGIEAEEEKRGKKKKDKTVIKHDILFKDIKKAKAIITF